MAPYCRKEAMYSVATRSRNYNVPLGGMNGRELEEANTSGLAL